MIQILGFISIISFQELQFFFPNPKSGKKGPVNTATLENCTCCIIKPHVVQAKLIGTENYAFKR